MPEANVEVAQSKGNFSGYSNIGASRFDEMTHFNSGYTTPGWQRAQRNKERGGFEEDGEAYDDNGTHAAFASGDQAFRSRRKPHIPLTIEGDLVAKSTGIVSDFSIGERVFHLKFGNGNITAIDGNKLVIQFDKAGEKRVVDSFVQRQSHRLVIVPHPKRDLPIGTVRSIYRQAGWSRD